MGGFIGRANGVQIKNVKERRGRRDLRSPRSGSFLRPLSAPGGFSDWPKRLCDKVGRLKKPTEGPDAEQSDERRGCGGHSGRPGKEPGRRRRRDGGVAAFFPKLNRKQRRGSLDMSVCRYLQELTATRREESAKRQSALCCSPAGGGLTSARHASAFAKACAGLLPPQPSGRQPSLDRRIVLSNVSLRAGELLLKNKTTCSDSCCCR